VGWGGGFLFLKKSGQVKKKKWPSRKEKEKVAKSHKKKKSGQVKKKGPSHQNKGVHIIF
jgi:hypothetical protein